MEATVGVRSLTGRAPALRRWYEWPTTSITTRPSSPSAISRASVIAASLPSGKTKRNDAIVGKPSSTTQRQDIGREMPRWRKENVDQFLQALPPPLKQSVEQLRLLQKKCDTLKQEYKKELRLLNAKYKRLYDPVYDTRAKLIRGKKGGAAFAIPGFWLKVFMSSATVGSTIHKTDEEILKYLIDVRVEPLETERNGFRLVFMFEPNDYFSMTELKKTYVLGDEDENLLVSSKGCIIDWKPNKNPKYKTQWKRGKQTIVETESFFDFFEPPELPVSDGSAELDLEQIHNIQEATEEDFDVGLVIKDVLIPNAVSWFTGEIVEESSDEGSSCAETESEGTE